MNAVYRTRAFNAGRSHDNEWFLDMVKQAAGRGNVVPEDAVELLDCWLAGKRASDFRFNVTRKQRHAHLSRLRDTIFAALPSLLRE